jgi:hypothetical protein
MHDDLADELAQQERTECTKQRHVSPPHVALEPIDVVMRGAMSMTPR